MARGFFRKLSFNKTLGAWASQWKRAIKRLFIPWYGKKGTGWWSNPRKALYNWWYRKTSISVFDLFGKRSTRKTRSKGVTFFLGVVGWLLLPAAFVVATTHMGVSKVKKTYATRKKSGGTRLKRGSGDVDRREKRTTETSRRNSMTSEKSAVANRSARGHFEEKAVQTSSRSIKKDINVKDRTVYSSRTTTIIDVQSFIGGVQSSAEEMEPGLTKAEYQSAIEYQVSTGEEMSTSKLSVVKEGESDIKPLWADNKSLGKLWKENIDRFFSDCEDSLREGKGVVGSVRDLMFSKGRITSKVGDDKVVPYKVIITIEPMEKEAIKAFQENGKKSQDLFPTKKDFWLFCNCDKQQEVCKHMIATLCAFGDLLDKDVEKLYCLRGVTL